MHELTASVPIHYYDTTTRLIACGVKGADHRSTKHPRAVTCETCLSLAGDRPRALEHGGVEARH